MTTIDAQVPTRSRLRSTQTRLLIVVALLAVAGVLFVWIVTGGGSSTASHSLGGPNEAARGAAVYSATGGAVNPTGGPNEAARGQAVSTASGSNVPGGPNETVRGQSAASAASH